MNLPIINYDKINSTRPIHLDQLAFITEIIYEKIEMEYKLKSEPNIIKNF
jgi:hypothetical protein